MTQRDLAQQVAVTHQFIGYLETAQKQPTSVLVEALGQALGFQPSFFFGADFDEFRDEECHFRRRQSTPVALRTRVLAFGTLFGELIAYLDEVLSLPGLNVPALTVRSREDVELAAEQCRDRWGLGKDLPIKNISRALELAGIVLARFESGAEKVDAFSRSGRRPIIVLTTDKGSTSRTRFDMAHECGHLVMHQGLDTGLSEIEKEADQFASAFLLPRMGLAREFPRSSRIDWDALFRLKKRWGASVAAIVRRGHDLRLLDSLQYQRAYKYIAAQGWLKGEPGEPAEETPEIVPLAVEALRNTYGMSPHSLCRHLGWAGSTYTRVTGLSLPPAESEPAPSEGQVIPFPRQRANRG